MGDCLNRCQTRTTALQALPVTNRTAFSVNHDGDRIRQTGFVVRRGGCPLQPRPRFCCQKNLNNIDLLIGQGHDFLAAVALLERWLRQYQAQQAKTKKAPTAPPVN
jgi:hypothetical protein